MVELPKFLRMLPVAVVRSSSDGAAISYVLPVLWMTSRFHTIGRSMVRRASAHITAETSASIPI